MSIDKDKLKALAEAASKVPDWYSPQSFGLSRVTGDAEKDFIGAAGPATILTLLTEISQLNDENERFRRYSDQMQADKKALAETRVLYTWLRKKVDQTNNEFVAVLMKAGQDWVPVHDLDRDLRAMIEREEP